MHGRRGSACRLSGDELWREDAGDVWLAPFRAYGLLGGVPPTLSRSRSATDAHVVQSSERVTR
eukprot:4107501-Prymnesium_polylepis.2